MLVFHWFVSPFQFGAIGSTILTDINMWCLALEHTGKQKTSKRLITCTDVCMASLPKQNNVLKV